MSAFRLNRASLVYDSFSSVTRSCFYVKTIRDSYQSLIELHLSQRHAVIQKLIQVEMINDLLASHKSFERHAKILRLLASDR